MKNCHGCKKFRSLPYHSQKPGPLSRDRIEKCFQFDFNKHRLGESNLLQNQKKSELKACILLFSCSVTRAVHIELVPSLNTAEFIKSFKRLISRRDKRKKNYSDNTKTFIKAGEKWLPNINKDQMQFLSMKRIMCHCIYVQHS